MTVPYYVPPEQLMKDRAEFARKGIARGKAIAAVEYADGILLMAQNPSRALNKISEIYDRVAFAGVGKYNEFEQLRVAGIRLADIKGYSYGRSDVTGKSLANAYSQTIGAVFTEHIKPYEVEILISEVGETPDENRLFRIRYDGTLNDERNFVAIGGKEEELTAALGVSFTDGGDLNGAIAATTRVFEQVDEEAIGHEDWEAAVLTRGDGRRAFRRLTTEEIAAARA